MTIVNAAGSSMTDVTDDSQLCDVTDDQKPPGTRSYLTVGLPDPHPASIWECWRPKYYYMECSIQTTTWHTMK